MTAFSLSVTACTALSGEVIGHYRQALFRIKQNNLRFSGFEAVEIVFLQHNYKKNIK